MQMGATFCIEVIEKKKIALKEICNFSVVYAEPQQKNFWLLLWSQSKQNKPSYSPILTLHVLKLC